MQNKIRAAGDAELLAVSKQQPIERIIAVLAEGHRVFGENKVQESLDKWPALMAEYAGISVHLIGPLQTNKVKAAVGFFAAIHSLDRQKLADKIATEVQTQGRAPDLFVQVNTGEEPQKSGVMPADLDDFVAACRAMDLPIKGLMVIPPAREEPSLHFALLRKMAVRNGLAGLSMGMSGDFETALAFGATHLRVGSAVFGERLIPR